MPATHTATLPRHGTWRTYTTADGLAGNRVEHIAEDRDGYLWFATWTGGLSRFDGDEFRTFTSRDGLAGDQVCALHLDRRGRLWIGTIDGGLCQFDGDSFHRFPEEAVSQHSITSIFEDRQGRLWFAGGLISYCDDGGFNDLIQGGKRGECWGIAQDKSGDLWFGFDRLMRYDGQDFQTLDQGDGLPAAEFIYAVASDIEGGDLWIGGDSELGRYDGQHYRPVQKSLGAMARKIQFDRQGRTWICSSGAGAYCFTGDHQDHFTVEDGLAFNGVNGICQDREGHIWFATWGGGVSCYDPYGIRCFGEEDGLPRTRSTRLLEIDAQLWIGFQQADQLAHYDDQTITLFNQRPPFTEPNPEFSRAICRDRQGQIWLGDSTGLVRFDGQTFHRLGSEQGFDSSFLSALAISGDGDLLIGHWRGDQVQLSRYDGRHFHRLWSADLAPNRFNITRILEADDGALWFATGTSKGVGIGKGLGRLAVDGTCSFYTTADGLPDDRIEDLLLDRQGRLWIATMRGLCRFDGTDFQILTTDQGLPNNNVQCLSQDGGGYLWIGTEGGVARYDGRTLQTLHSPYVASILQVLQDHTGHCWFATENGLVRYRPGTVPPRIRLLQVVADQIYPAADQIAITAATRQVIFEFKGMSFRTQSRHMLYTWRLQGHDADWCPPEGNQRAYYRDLPPGDYTFQVRAIDCDFNRSEPTTMALQVLPDPRLELLNESLKANGRAEEFLGDSPSLAQVQHQLAQVGPTDMTVLIFGETGTGKGVAARALHRLSPRPAGPFIQVNCGAIPDGLVESELFGHEKGAFTGADRLQLGKVELAAGGTFFLDEIGDLPLDAQVKLLRLLEERVFERVGGAQTMEADTRFVAATNRDLEVMVAEGTFRQDLYYRLRTFVVNLPPLRQRQEDIALLAHFFTGRFAAHLSRPAPAISPAALIQLKAYQWPGNVRELEHLMQRATLLCRDDRIESEDLGLEQPNRTAETPSGSILPLAEQEKRAILRALEVTDGVIFGEQGAAKLLDINPQTLRARIRKHGIGRSQKKTDQG